MPSPMTALGIIIFLTLALLILRRYRASERPYPFPRHGYAGAAILVGGQFLTLAGVELVALYLTPIAWTGYILWADAAVFSIRGKSLWKTHRGEFACLAFCSIPLWLIFEAYNLRLANWIYIGLPQSRLARNFGYAWSFATIWPGIFETAILLRALGIPEAAERPPAGKSQRGAPGSPVAWFGALLLIVPVLLPPRIGSYLFGAVWLGFIFFLEPVNRRLGRESLWRDLQQGDSSRLVALLGAGIVCGVFWEFWNYSAHARWVYVFPILPQWKLFAMPLPGYFGFPAFAVECFAMFAFLAPMINAALKKLGRTEELRWDALKL